MDQFKTADGEIIDPYRILKVGRKADKEEIRKSYRMLSKKYHPDGVRFREVFPGKW
jgi:curved DNA-binding protein CbpA